MSDDIVTRLREHAEDEAMLGNDWLRDVMRDAADEIEKLQQMNRFFRNQIKELTKYYIREYGEPKNKW